MVNFTEIWHTLEHAIVNYTGLSPATFFTVLSVGLAFYYVVSGWFQSPPPPLPPRSREMEMKPLQPPVQLGEVTEEELTAYDGSDPNKPLLMAIKGQIYDVTQSRMFYGPGGPYALFAGKDASRALAKMSFEEKDLTGDISGLGPYELDALQDWEYKFMSKYVTVGTIKKTVPVTDANASETSEASTQTAGGEHGAESKEVETKEEKHASEPIEVKPKEEKHVSQPTEIETKEVSGAEDTME